MSHTSTFLRRTFGGVALVLLLAPSAHAAFGEAQPFNLAGAGPSHPAAVAGSDDGTIVSVWAADPGLSWFSERPPAVQIAFQRLDGHRVTFGAGLLASATRVGLVMDRGGTATVVWQSDVPEGAVFVVRCTARGCAPARRVGTGSFHAVPVLAVDAANRVLIVWPGRTKRGKPSLLHRMIDRGRLGAIGAIGEIGTAPVVSSAGGRFVIGWNTTQGIRTTVVARAGRSRAPRTALAGSGIADFRLTGGAAGMLAAWRPAGDDALALAGVDVDGRVGRADVVAAARNAVFDLALGPQGRAAVAWCVDGLGSTVTAALREPGERFGAPVALTLGGGCTPGVAVDGAGRATVVSAGASPTGQAPYAATADPGRAFGAAADLDPNACIRTACGEGQPYLESTDVVAAGRSTTAVWVSAQQGYAARMDG